MARFVTVEELNASLGRELDALPETGEVLYVCNAGRLSAAVLDSNHYALLVDRLDFLEDSLAARLARERTSAVAWSDVRDDG